MPDRSSETRRFHELDGLRAVAILLVLAFHSWFFLQFALPDKTHFATYSQTIPAFLGFVRRGDVGVDIFFVLSGFLLSWQLFTERRSQGRFAAGRYYARRVFRIYPLYLVALTIVALGGGLRLGMLGNVFAYNIWLDPLSIVIPWTWSLSVELEFYLVVPLLILLARSLRRAVVLALALAVLSVVWSLMVLVQNPVLAEMSLIDLEVADARADLVIYYRDLYAAMPVRLTQFGAGILAAYLSVYKSGCLPSVPRAAKVVLSLVAVAGIGLPGFYNPYAPQSESGEIALLAHVVFERVLFGAAIAILIFAMAEGGLPGLRRLLSARWLEPVARFSFSIYLFHPVFVGAAIWLLTGGVPQDSIPAFWPLVVFCLALAASMALGFATWYAIERPAIRLGRRIFG